MKPQHVYGTWVDSAYSQWPEVVPYPPLTGSQLGGNHEQDQDVASGGDSRYTVEEKEQLTQAVKR